MKRAIAFLVAAIMAFSMVACTAESNSNISADTESRFTSPDFAVTEDNSSNTYVLSLLHQFSDGVAFAAVKKKGEENKESQYAIVDTSGNVLVLFERGIYPGRFENGIAMCETEDGTDYAIDKQGNVVFTSKTVPFDDVIAFDGGCFAVYRYIEGFDATGYIVSFLNEQGATVLTLDEIYSELPEIANCGDGVFAQKVSRNAGGEVTWEFYDAHTGNTYRVGGISSWASMSRIFNDGYAIIEGTRMGDDATLVTTSGNKTTIELDYNYHDFGPVSDGGYVCTCYYRDTVEAMYFVDVKSGKTVCLDNYGSRVDLDRVKTIKYDDGRLLLPLIGTDGKNYYTILDDAGKSLFEPVACESAYMLGNNRYSIRYEDREVVIDGNGTELFEIAAGNSISNYRDGIAEVSNDEASYYVDPYGNRLFESGFFTISDDTNIVTIMDLESAN